MHPYIHAQERPDHPAYIMTDTGEVVTYAQLEARSNQGAHLIRHHGLKRGDSVVIFLENHARFLELCWAAQRSGLYYTPLSSRMAPAEIDYILGDLKPKLFFTSTRLVDVARRVPALQDGQIATYLVDGDDAAFRPYLAARDSFPQTPIADQSYGIDLLYSSGSTGRPKGVRVPLRDGPIEDFDPRWKAYHTIMGFDRHSVHYIPSPFYHALPIHHAMTAQHYGGTVLMIEKFDAAQALQLIDHFQVTQASWVAAMFIKLLKLPQPVREQYSVDSMVAMVHGAGPCPIHVKQAIIEWFGPIVFETYGMTEGFGSTTITSREWLQHKGSVGKPTLGAVHIVDEDSGLERPAGVVGTIYFENPRKVEYLNDAAKTASFKSRQGWATAGDMGYVDADGYLYITGRKTEMIISGGVNLYPQEIENALIRHPEIADVAVFGIPNDEFGEEIKAVVQPVDMDKAGPELADNIIAFCKTQLSVLKAPRSIDFMAALPRHETGKLYKRLLRDPYWAGRDKDVN